MDRTISLLPYFLSFMDIYVKRSIKNMPNSNKWSLLGVWGLGVETHSKVLFYIYSLLDCSIKSMNYYL